MMIALMGFKGAGKDTFADCFVEMGYEKFSFASTVKDVLSSIFSWDRELLEGDTVESRVWREIPDEFWSRELGIQGFSPRYALSHIATDVMRKHFHQDIWVTALRRKIQGKERVIITDCRFMNEVNMIKSDNTMFIRIDKGDKPKFWDLTSTAEPGFESTMSVQFPEVHRSEWEWNQVTPNFVVRNNGSKDDLKKQAIEIYKKIG